MSVNWADFKPIADANAPATSEGPSGVDWGKFKPISDASPTLADYAKGAASGVNQLVSGVGYLAERSGATNVGKYIRDIGDTGQRYWSDSMTPAGRRAAESQVFEDDPNSVIPSLGERPLQALAMGTAQSAPSMFAAAVPGGIAAAGLRGVAGMAASRGIGGAIAPIAAGAASPIGGWGANFAGNLAARVPSALGFGAAEGAIAGASNAAQWKSDIEQKPLDELRKMPGFAALEAQIGEQAARQQVAEQGASDILRNTTISTGGIGALTGGGALGSAFQRVTTGAKGGLFGAVGRDAAKEAGQELLQSGGERAVQNIATRDYLDPNQSVIQGVVSDALSGAAVGGVMGGVAGGGSHLVKGPLQKAAEASSATVPTDAATIPPGGQTSATIPPEAAQPAGIPAGTVPADPETQPPAAGIASADQNTPAAPGISPVPVSTAEPPLLSNQEESAGVPVVDQQAPLSGEYLPASDGRAPFVIAGEIETGAIPGQFSRVYPETGQRRISQTRSITDQSQEGAAKSGNETEIPQPAEPGQQAKPASVSDSARLDWEKDAEALATEATRLREMAARAVGQTRIRLTDLAGRMEAAREAIVGQAGATNKDSLTVEGKAPAVTSQSPPGKFDDAIDAVVKARAKLTPIRDSAESDSDAERTNALINDVGKASLGDLQAMIRIELASKKKQNAGVKVELENVLRAGSSRLRQRAIDAVKSVRSPDSTGDPWLTVSPVVKRIVDKWGQAHSADASKGSGMSPKSVSGTPGNPENPETGKNGKSGTSGKSEDEPVRGAVGMKLSAGQVVTTLTGRTTTPFPKFQSSTGKMTQAHLNAVDRWLLSNAAEEAESRGDDFNALPFRRALESKTIPQADKDSAEMYLFEWQPDVIKPITRPLVPESKSPPVAANETATDAPQAPLSSAEAPQASDDDRKADLEKRRSDLEAKRKQPTTPPNMRRDDLVGAILRVTGGNGVHSSMAPDTVGDSANRATKLRGLFTNRGTADLGEVAMLLRESENFDVRDGEHLAELIRQASFGDVPVSMSRQERDAESAKEKQHRDRIRAMAMKYGVRSVGVKFSELESRVFAMMDARNKKAIAALDERAQKRFDAAMSESQKTLSDDELDAVISDLYRKGMSPREFWNKATSTLMAMAEEARQERALDAEPTTEEPSWFADFPDESGNQPTGGGSESQPVDQASSRPGIELAGQTPAELAKQEADRVAAEKAKKAASDKAAAEMSAGNVGETFPKSGRGKKESAIDAAMRSVGIDPNAPIDKSRSLRRDADKLMSEARKMIDRIPPGQPVHSTRDRNLREKSLEKARKARELYDLADAIDATKARKESPEDALPAGWTEASPGGMAASRDKTTGGIVDKNIATGKWFFVSNLGGVESKDGFDTRDEAFSALADASRMADKGKSANSEESPSAEKQQAAKDLNDALSDLADIFGKKFRANMMPEQEQKLFPVMVRVFDAAFRLGYHSFKDAARFVLQTIREKIGAEVADAVTIDHLQGAYIAMSGGKELATAKRDVVSVESKTELEQGNVPDERSGTDLERDSENAATENGVGKKGVRDGSGRDGGAGGPGVPGAETTGSSGSGVGIPGPEALADRAASDNEVYVGAPGVSPGASGDSVSQRGGDLRLDGPPIEPDAAKGIGAAATGRPDLARKIALQASAPTDPGASIADALPMLSAGQQEDVAKAERRFAVPDGYGMLFTNGTGTGKTFSGLGIIKRFSNAGKNNILIVVPNDKIIEDWQKSGRMLGLDISELKNTKDAGKGIVVTTYANMGANSELVRREWDLVVHDEAHHLMENSEARSTNALRTLRAITLHPDGANDRHAALYADEIMKLADLRARLKNNIEIGKSSSIPVAEKERIAAENARLSESLALAEKRNRETQKIVREDVESRQGAVRPRALFLSFTPFAYEPSIDWANGYLFDYNEGRPSDKTESRGYNQGSNSDQFFMQHFGYRMRTGKLTQPDAKVDRGLMQRQFNAFLKKKGSLSGRVLDVEADYDRRFLLVESAIGQRIDEALEWFEDQGKKTNDKDRKAALRDVRKVIADKFDYQSRRYLLEAIKAQEVIPHIREHMAMGRKVVVFHDYNQGGGFNPFDMSERKMGAEFSESGDTDLINSVIREFKTEFKDLIGSDLFKASSPIANFQKQFPGVLLVNGLVPAKTRRENVARFQDDASGPQLILVQSQAGKEGISLHDTTGKHQRVLFNLGQPTQPTMAMQQEGRIYRMGQVTDAIIRYLNTGTNWERWAFATTIAQRASAAENLGSGELARALKDAFISGFEESGNYRAGMEDEGKGGKARDAAANNVLSEYDRAKAFYFGTQKKDSRTKAQEGTDYYATPEPIGLKMVEFADIRAGDDVLEPSAGHGAIARWIPEHAKRTAIEPSTALRSRLAMVFDGNIIGSNFEDLNVVNKFDAIVMNPPFGTGGKTAVDHLAKAATHLRDGGRIVALLPTGPAADKRLDKWLNGGEEVAVKPLVTHPELGPIYKGDTISTQTDTGLVVERMLSADTIVAKSPTMRAETAHLVRNIVKADPTGPRTTESGPSKDVYQIADIQLPAVTFERAGTGVRTHIVVLEKQTNKNKLNTVPQKISRDYSDAENINTLFDRIENAFVRPRENAREEESAQTKAPSVGAQGSEKVRPDGGPATVEKMLPGGKLLTDAPKITYTTKAGKKLDGVIARTLTNGQATAIDPFTWPKDGGFFIRIKHVVRPESNNETRYNLAAGIQATPADRAVYDMAQEGKSAAEILEFIGNASRRPFNRYLANALKNLGASSTITLDSQGWWRFGNTSRAQKYAAAYNSRTDTVALFTAREAERHLLHELVHAATMKAIKAGGPAAVRMRALFKHVQKSGKVNGQYGMSNLDEFVAEAFTNPKFQEALKGVPAPAGSTLKSAWQWFVNIVARVLGFKTSVAKTALDRAMTIGAQLMRENAAVMAASEDTRYAIAWHGTPHVWGPEPGFPHGRPRLDKMGTGEGAQAYGWGWYSAEAQGVAASYRNDLSEPKIVDAIEGTTFDRHSFAGEETIRNGMIDGLSNDRIAEKLLDLAARVERIGGFGDNVDAPLYRKAANEVRAGKYKLEDAGTLYQLDIPDDVMPKLLDWDKPMSRQPKDVQASLRRLYDKLGWRWNDSQTGNVIYETLTGDMLGARNHGLYGDEGSKAGEAYDSVGRKTNHLQAASEYLASLGIPGLRYLDGTSRNKGEGSYNYVIWDQKVLDRIALLERNGEKLDAIRAAEETRYSLDGSQPFDGREVATTPLKPGTTTLMVDGTERPALNSNGKPIHWSEEGIRNFWRWFGDSPSVDYNGRPTLFYHGGQDDFSEIHRKGRFNGAIFILEGRSSGYRSTQYAVYLRNDILSLENMADLISDNPEVLATIRTEDEDVLEKIAESLTDGSHYPDDESVWDAIGAIDEADAQVEMQKLRGDIARKLGFSSVRTPDEFDGDTIMVLDPLAIKSATGNTGAFSPTDPDIRFNLATDWQKSPVAREVATTPLKPGTTTLMVDGTERPALNSNGKPIHWSEEGVRNFWRWFSGSKVVDAQGRPLVVYHGSPDIRFIKEEAIFKSQKDRTGFGRSDAAHWFSSDPRTAKSYSDPRRAFDYQNSEEGVIESYLRIENPLVVHADGQEWKTAQKRGKTSDVIEEARASSKDGVIINNVRDDYNNSRSTRPTRTFTVFESTQIKSSTGNTGAFSPTDPDIRFNLATDWQKSPVAREVSKAISAAARSDSALSWLNPVQTQYHKAETLAKQGKFGFKRVFDLGQKFLSDISRFAIQAENSAPTLFHQIRSFADAKQAVRSALGGDFGGQHNADIKAIAAPLYEGTLYGGADPTKGIVWSDDQLRGRFGLTDRQITLYREAREAVKSSMDELAKALITRHAKRENVMVDPALGLQEFSESVRDMLNLRASTLDQEAQAKLEDALRQAEDLREAGGKDNRDKAKAMEREANNKARSQKDEAARIRATAEDVMAIAEKAQNLQDAGYFPLMRFGRHTVTAKDADGKVQHFSMHDGIPLVPRSGQAQANRLADALREEHPEWTVTTGLMNPEKYKLYHGMNVDALQLFADHLDDETRNTYQEIIRLATNERSALRRMLKREGTPGFDRDARRTLASFILSNARYTSSVYHLADMAKAAELAELDGGDVGAEAVKLYDYVTKPQEEAAKLRSFLFFNFLGGSLASAMVNATQVPMMTFPRLSQYEDAGKLAKRLVMAAKMAMRNPADISGVVGDALRRAEADGVTAPHQIYEMTATASANVFGGSRAGSALLRAWGAPFALAEAFNRRTTFIAAFQIAQGMTESQLRDTGAATAFEFAENMVNETQGIYNRGNRMNIGRGVIGATVMTFKQYSVMYLEMFSRLPAKQKAIMAGVLILAAGSGGLPFAEDIEDIIDTIGQWLGYRTNARRTIRRGLSDMVGQQAADVAMNGVLSQLGIDLHSRLGLQNLIPGTALIKPSTTDKGREFQDLLGPAASVVAAMGQALQDLATGHPDRAAMEMAPTAFRNLAQGAKMAAKGYSEDAKGRKGVPVSEAESVAKMVGFNPKRVADYGAVKRDLAQDQRLVTVKREEFSSAIADAILANDPEARAEVVRAMREWNAKNPDARVSITAAAIGKRVRDARAEGADRMLRSLPRSMRGQAREELAR